MITLSGVTLPDSMVWTDRHSSSLVAQSVKRTLTGRQIISALQLIAGRPITLQSSETFGWINKTTLDLLIPMAEGVGSTYTLNFGAEVYTVAFRHHDSPALEFFPLVPRTTHVSTDYFVGTLKLITV